MAEKEYLNSEKEADLPRSSDGIRQDLAEQKETISLTVDQIGERISDKLDWREYVKDSPYWAIGAAAGLGYFASRVFMPRTTPMERIVDSIAQGIHDSLSGLKAGTAGPNLIKLTLLTIASKAIATKAAAGWIKDSDTTKVADGGGGPQS